MYDDDDDDDDDMELPLLLELALLVSDELVEITELSSSSLSLPAASLAAWAWACANISLGAFFRNSRMPSVSGPSPMLVKKLMAYRVLRALSLGNMPLNQSRDDGSCLSCPLEPGTTIAATGASSPTGPSGSGLSVSNRCFRVTIPIASAISWTRILMKMRDELVVSSSFRCMHPKTDHENESVWSRWPKSLATLRNLFVSNLWMVLYCVANASSNAFCHLSCNRQNLPLTIP